ncbi:MAG: GGDEF domain-containing protein [Phycisphaeraceae bacterium]
MISEKPNQTQQDPGEVIVVVGDAALARSAAGRPHTTVNVEDYLQAMGVMHRRKVRAVVGHMASLGRDAESTLHALRRINPAAKLLLVAEPAEEPDAMRAVRLGFDDYFVLPLRTGEIQKALGSQSAIRNPQPAIKDESLLDQLLTERGSICEKVVEQVKQQTGCDVWWSAQPVIDAKACVPLQHESTALGHLASNECDDQRLYPAAQWASRWLAMEQRLIHLRHLAYHDELTGAWNRRYFDRFLESVLNRARKQRFRVTLLIFDIDDFKLYNDRFGHDAGDEILCEATRLMQFAVRKHDVVARIGGDEFGVIFWDAEGPRKENSQHPHTPHILTARFQKAICEHRFPKLSDLAPGTLTISGGLASYPWDGQSPAELIKLADNMLLESKRQGKDKVTLGPGAMRVCNLKE